MAESGIFKITFLIWIRIICESLHIHEKSHTTQWYKEIDKGGIFQYIIIVDFMSV